MVLQNKKILDYELDLIERHDIQWATVEDDTYPALLREIYLAPAVLYWQGSLFCARPELVEGYLGAALKNVSQLLVRVKRIIMGNMLLMH